MMYCDTCGTKRKWPVDALCRSTGACEICGKKSDCNDIPSKDLPLPKEVNNDK